MTETPLVSIVCTVYNKAPWLEKTIQGFLDQQVDFPMEILIIDDASTDSSAQIMERFAADYPGLVRVFYNTENQGISKTWVSICQEAKGFYIARADGDDFWIDPYKLQKQVNLLQATPNSRWSNTDFDIYNEKGEFVSPAGFENGAIPLADSFEKMLATRGFTMASTWLVERELMLEVNDLLDLTTSDDTFNLQMDLFQRTELAYLPEATVAYVINQGSDSRPKDFRQIEQRFNKLLAVQKDYLDRYPESNYREMLDYLLDRSNRFELELTKQSFGKAQIGIEKVTIYFDVDDKGFQEDQKLQYSLQAKGELAFTLPEHCRRIRVDLSELPSFYASVKLLSLRGKTELMPQFTNAICVGERYIFPNPDPQMIYEVNPAYGKVFVLLYELLDSDQLQSRNYVGTVLAQDLLDMEYKAAKLTETLFSKNQEIAGLRQQLQAQETHISQLQHQHALVIGSRRWTIPTKLINFFRRKP